jgi:hypothetical protein
MKHVSCNCHDEIVVIALRFSHSKLKDIYSYYKY